MYFMKKSNIIYRDYKSFAYLTDNRNFGYSSIYYTECDDIGDKIVSQSGAIFLSALSNEPQDLDILASKICEKFIGVDIDTILKDAEVFYQTLESEGFIISGKTKSECHRQNVRIPIYIPKPDGIHNHYNAEHKKKDTQVFFEEYFGGIPQLTNIHIEITGKCNERCVHCYIPHDLKINQMSQSLFDNLIEQCKEMNILHLTISGGEPMIHRDFCHFLRKCTENNFSVNLLSNLTLLTDAILEEIKRNNLISVQVSLYSMDPCIHDAITQTEGSFIKTKNAIIRLIENNIPLQISCPIMKQNINSFKTVLDWGIANNIHVSSDFVLIAKYDHTVDNLENRLSLDDIENILIQKSREDDMFLHQLYEDVKLNRVRSQQDIVCSICNSSICVSETGLVYPCVGWQSFVLGNILESSLKNIWSQSEKIQYLQGIRRQDFPQCIECPDNEFCTICMARNANENPDGNPFVLSDYFCKLTGLYKKIFLNHYPV